jgi:hypothetical protein
LRDSAGEGDLSIRTVGGRFTAGGLRSKLWTEASPPKSSPGRKNSGTRRDFIETQQKSIESSLYGNRLGSARARVPGELSPAVRLG